MHTDSIGQPTYHTRVQRWECDYNDHWNTCFYGRSFQMAAEVVATSLGGPNLGAGIIRSRHIRFHRELFVSAPVTVQSAVLDGGLLDGSVVHLLTSSGQVAATAIDLPGGAPGLPRVRPEDVPLAMPRGLKPQPPNVWTKSDCREMTVALGTVQAADLDFTGALTFERLVQHGSTASHHQLDSLGFSASFSNRTRINRMAVEQRVTRGVTPSVGTPLRAVSRLTQIKGKNFWTTHRIFMDSDTTVALIESCLVTVDLTVRRAVDVPEFLHAALSGPSQL
jgi:acyl-CoA thioester hydrolase